jgi:murein tripeptide amidase MpaA
MLIQCLFSRIGTSSEGRPIEGLKIGYPIANTTKRAFWIDGNIHAREWASSHTALFIINQLISGYGRDKQITHYLNSLNFYIVPNLNPDGYEYSRSSLSPEIRLWRKNRSPEKCSPSIWGGWRCCQGVDLNRYNQYSPT